MESDGFGSSFGALDFATSVFSTGASAGSLSSFSDVSLTDGLGEAFARTSFLGEGFGVGFAVGLGFGFGFGVPLTFGDAVGFGGVAALGAGVCRAIGVGVGN